MEQFTAQERQQQAVSHFNGFRAALARDLGINLLIGQGSIGPFQTPNGLRTETTAGWVFDVIQDWSPPKQELPPDDVLPPNEKVKVEKEAIKP